MLNSSTILTWAALFAAYLLFDVLYAKYVLAVSKLQALRAANISFVMYGLTIWGTIQYVDNIWNAIPIAFGAWVGTYITLIKEKKNEGK